MFENTEYGFKWNSCEITRAINDFKDPEGWIILILKYSKT